MKDTTPQHLLSDNILYLRKEKGWTQTDLADELDLAGKATVSAWESGRAIPRVYLLCRLCDLFEVSMDDIVRTKIEK